MTRDEVPPKDDGTGREPQSPPDTQGHRQEPSIVPDDASGSAQAGDSSKRPAWGTHGDAHDQVRQPEALLDAFAAQYTEKLKNDLYKYAARRLSGARKLSSDDDAAQELVHQVVFDTIDGRVRWDFMRRRLKPHLKFLIWREFYARLRRVKRLRHVPIHAITEDDMELERALRVEAANEIERAEARDAIADLYRRAEGDADVLALIDAIVQNQMSRVGLREATGFSMPRYRRAMRRFNRLVHQVGMEQELIRNGKEGT